MTYTYISLCFYNRLANHKPCNYTLNARDFMEIKRVLGFIFGTAAYGEGRSWYGMLLIYLTAHSLSGSPLCAEKKKRL